jgi:hypothetical protein
MPAIATAPAKRTNADEWGNAPLTSGAETTNASAKPAMATAIRRGESSATWP